MRRFFVGCPAQKSLLSWCAVERFDPPSAAMTSASTLVRLSLAFWLPLVLMACSKTPSSQPEAPPGPTQAPAAPAKVYAREIHGKKLDLVFHADPLPNLVYQLDCMAGRHPCSKAAYE